MILRCATLLAMLLAAGAQATAAEASASDSAKAREWTSLHMGSEAKPADPAFSFLLDGTSSREFLGNWKFDNTSRKQDETRLQHTCTYADVATGLVVRCVAVIYDDFPAVEWTVFLKNTGSKDTPILEDIQAIDSAFLTVPGDVRLLYSQGSHESPSDFAPQEKTLNEPIRLAPYGGRSSDGVLPFFQLAMPDKTGVIMGIGWTGQWAASFEKGAASSVRVRAGMERTHLVLHPGEEIRTPAILLLFWSGEDPIDGNNRLRRLLLKHYSPKQNGKPVNSPIGASPHATIGFTDTTETNMIQTIKNIADHKLPVDTFWIDAGWHGNTNNWARNVGSWEPNPERFPNGMKPVADAAHARGLRFLLWFEPERVMRDTWLYENHRDWLLAPANLPPELQYQENDGFYLLNLGHPEALAWAKKTFSGMISDFGVDIYRQDFNMTPLYFWRNGEPENRQGMNEIRHVMGLYDLYDTLMREHPGLIIDNCASGGRRIDFEIMRRALSLWRTDCCWDPLGQQGMTYGISPWMPITGVGALTPAPYNFRSGMGAHMSLAFNYTAEPGQWAEETAALRQYEQLRPLFTADFYRLTPYSLETNKWIAWQYHSPEKGEGLVQAFRRDACAEETLVVKLRDLDAKVTYTVQDLDTDVPQKTVGAALMDPGLTVRIPATPGAALVHYWR